MESCVECLGGHCGFFQKYSYTVLAIGQWMLHYEFDMNLYNKYF